jgi:GNAT superfamily N-acetyltransferase
MTTLPAGLTLFPLTSETLRPTSERVRAFCLGTIKETYGYEYRRDWHWDLDSLLSPQRSPYLADRRGAFYVLRQENGTIAGTAGIRCLVTSQNILQRYGARYLDHDAVGYLCRVYVGKPCRKRGLGDVLINLCREQASRLGYSLLYFHCERQAARLRAYWESHGFSCFAEDAMSAHYDGPVLARQSSHPAAA